MDEMDLATACEMWQGGRDSGSTPLRAAARVLTGIPHYFRAGFIDRLDEDARSDAKNLAASRCLLHALTTARLESAEDIARRSGYEGPVVAARGIASKFDDKDDADGQIDRLIRQPNAVIPMPLWGFSLDDEVARGFGSRFRFELVGPFVGIPAWVHSGIKAEEAEIIGGGLYAVERVTDEAETTVVTLRQCGRLALLDDAGS